MQSACLLGISRTLVQSLGSSSLRNAVVRTGPKHMSSLPSTRMNFSATVSRPFEGLKSSLGRESVPLWLKAGGLAGAGLALSIFTVPKILCEPHPTTSPIPLSKPSQASPGFQSPEAPPPQSSLSYLDLTFGTVAGICSGVFVKKGARAVAFVLGGVFVLLQYLGSLNVLRVDWSRMGSRFENLIYTTNAVGQKRAPNVGSLFRWITDFLTANFQQRATFIAGFILGLRIG